jgi:hypothetical protein
MRAALGPRRWRPRGAVHDVDAPLAKRGGQRAQHPDVERAALVEGQHLHARRLGLRGEAPRLVQQQMIGRKRERSSEAQGGSRPARRRQDRATI